MQTIGEAWLVYRLTGSSVLLGLVTFSSQFPVFLFAPVAGVVADRVNRHRIVIATQGIAMVLAFVLAGLTLSGRIRIWQIFMLAALLGVRNAFDLPARQAFLVELVGRQDLTNAIALNSSMFNGARIVGPAVGGILVAAVGEGWCFLLNAVSYVAVIVGLLFIHLAPSAAALGRGRGAALQQVVEGFRWVATNAPIRALLLLLGIVSLLGMPYAVLMPIFADQILHGGARGLGILMGASGLGALVGALLLAGRSGVSGLGRWVALGAVGFGTSLTLFSLSRSFWLSALLLFPVGFSVILQMASSNTLIQSMVPDELRGRVMAVYSMMFMGMAPTGALFAGILAERIGAPVTVAAGGVVCLLSGAFFLTRLPLLRGEARRLIVAQQTIGGHPVDDVTATGA